MSKTVDFIDEEACLCTDSNTTKLHSAKVEETTAAHMADWFKALGDPTRVKIIYALLNQELCVHDLSVVLEMGQSAVSHQLRVLRNVRMVKRRKVGKTVFYSLYDDHVEQVFQQTLQHIKHD